MAIPKTFGAEPDSTFSSLNGYAPSAEDRLRYAVWLMLWSDDVNRKAYSYDDDDAGKGVRIRQNIADRDLESGGITLPQQVVGVAIANTTWRYQTGNAGTKKITIAVMHMERPDTSWLSTDVDAPQVTPETRLAKITEILMLGTIIDESQLTEDHGHVVVDPYESPRKEDGTYDPDQLKRLTTKPPDVRQTTRQTFPNRVVKSEAEAWKLDPVKDFAVAYGVLATYDVEFIDRKDLRHGG